MANEICHFVAGTKTVISADSGSGRTKNDREAIARTWVGLGCNPNVAAVIVHGASLGGEYPELKAELIAKQIAETGKRVELLRADDGETLNLIIKGIDLAREMAYETSKIRRKAFDDFHITLGVKCGASDPTSGIAGNPVIGYVFDKLVATGGTALFGETTEIIGAEHIMAKRAVNRQVEQAIIDAVLRVDELTKSTGQDIRTINPVPANITGFSEEQVKIMKEIKNIFDPNSILNPGKIFDLE